MASKLLTESNYYIKPRAMSFLANDGDPNRVFVSIAYGTTILVFADGVIPYDEDGQPQKWILTGYSTSLATNDPYYIYVRLSRIEYRGMIVFSVNNYDIDGNIITEDEAATAEDENTEQAETTDYYIRIGSLTGTDGSTERELVYNSGKLTTLENSYTKEEANNQFMSFEVADKRYLNAVDDDTAKGVITFEKGIKLGSDETVLSQILTSDEVEDNTQYNDESAMSAGAFAKMFAIKTDDQGNTYINTPYTFVSERAITSLGDGDTGEEEEGGGVSYDRLDSWEEYQEGSGAVLSADLGYDLKNQVDGLSDAADANTQAIGDLNLSTENQSNGGIDITLNKKTGAASTINVPVYDMSNPNNTAGLVDDVFVEDMKSYVDEKLSEATPEGYLKLDSDEPQTISGTVYHEQAYFNNVPFADTGDTSVRMATMNDVPSITPLTESGTEIAKITQGSETVILYAPQGTSSDVDAKLDELEEQIGNLGYETAGLSQEIESLKNTKSGAFYLDSNTNILYIFTTEEAKSAFIASGDESGIIDQFVISGGGGASSTLYAMQINGLNDKYSFTTSSESMVISATFESKVKYAGSEEYVTFSESAIFSIDLYKEGSSTPQTITAGNIISNGGTFTFDLKPYVGSGNNTIIVRAVGLISSASGVATSDVYVTSMALLPFNFNWWTPYIKGDTYTLGGLKILGSLNKTLHIEVVNHESGYSKDYTVAIGTATYEEIAYSFADLEHPEQTGVYTVNLWLSATINGEDIYSDTLSYEIICIATADVSTAQLIAINDAAYEIDNYAENTLFSYAVYDGGNYTATPTITLKLGDTTIATSNQEVNTGVANVYTYAFAVTTSNTTEQIDATVVLGDALAEFSFVLLNDTSLAPTEGYSFYMDAATRSNADANKTEIINEADGSTVSVNWTDMAWVDGMDGWTTDKDGNRCLLLPAMSKAEVALTPFKNKSIVTIEMLYKVDNASDFDDDIIKIATATTESWIGMKIKPTNIVLHTQMLFEDDLRQGYNTEEGKIVHLVVTIIQNYAGIGNLAMIYVNGGKKCAFEWSTTDSIAHDGKLILGSDTADLYLYKMYVYDKALSMQDIEQNYKASLHSVTEKAQVNRREKEILDDSGNLSYDKIYGKYNTFVVELPQGAKLPNKLTNPSNEAIEGTNLYINIVQDPTCSIQGDWLNVPVEGQGTNAMMNYRWNLRSKTSSAYGKFRITAKKNVASSMHSHKRGATSLYNDLNLAIVGANEAGGRVAVYQYPVYGFLKIADESNAGAYIYEPIKLYTIGPDKGDKSTFGYDNEAYEGTLIHMEGTDHSPRGVGMDYPWEWMTVNTNTDGDAFIGADNGSGGLLQEAWEIGACGDKEEVADMKSYMDTEFAPAYNLDYECTPLLVGLPAGTSIDDVNADVALFRRQTLSSGFSYGDCIVYIDGTYDTYCYNELTKTYVADGRKCYTGLDTYGFDTSVMASYSTMDEKTAYIVSLRKARYRAEMGNYWHLEDNLFHPCFLDIIGATDNEKKNSYPYKFATLVAGGRWRWRQDDLDTIFDVNNQGSADKKYSILNTDMQGSTMIFKGNTSYHWRCIREYYKDELKNMMQRIFDKMVSLCPSGYGSSKIQRIVGCIKYYFWDYAQEYFTIHAYNADAKWTYEDTWALYKADTSVNAVHPLQQLLGSHYEAERAWVELRIRFLASMYEYAAFADYVDTSEGQVSFRQGGDFTFELTSAIDMRPSVIQGANSNMVRAEGRVMAGDAVTISTTADTSADTMVYIQGADWMQDIGDFSKVQIGSSSRVFNVTSKRLQTLKVGDETAENVTTNIGGLNLGSCPSLVEIEARNVANLSGEVNLTTCPRLRRAYFGGTKATQILLPSGSKIEEFDLPSSLMQLTLRKLPLLTVSGLTYDELTALTYLWVEGNANLSGYDLLRTALDGSSPLNNIRVIGFTVDGDATDVEFLATLADGSYHGINDDGTVNNAILPVLQGTVNVDGNIYEDDKIVLQQSFPNVIINALGYYVKFADAEVLSVLLANITTDDGIGLTTEDIEGVTSIGRWFKGNTTIETFDEFEKFTGVTSIVGSDSNGAFMGCTSLASITLPSSVTSIGGSAFQNCAALDMVIPHAVTSIGIFAFRNTGIKIVDVPNLATTAQGAFGGCTSLQRVESLGVLTAIPNHYQTGYFQGCTSLYHVRLPETLTIIGVQGFTNCSALKTFIIDAVTPPSIGYNAFSSTNSTFLIYVPDVSVEDYKAASGWAGYASRIYPFTDYLWIQMGNVLSFADSAVEAICLANWDTDGDGVMSKEETQAVTSIGTVFRKNTGIESFEELSYFTGVTKIGAAFYGCTNLKKVALPISLTSTTLEWVDSSNRGIFQGCSSLESCNFSHAKVSLSDNAFSGCVELSDIVDYGNIRQIGGGCFLSCTKLSIDVNMPLLTGELNSSFYSTAIYRITNLGTITVLKSGGWANSRNVGTFDSCTKLEYASLPDTITSIAAYSFYGCSSLKVLIINATTPPTLGNANALSNTNDCPIYVPDESVTLYQEATNWSSYSSRIKPLSEYVEE